MLLFEFSGGPNFGLCGGVIGAHIWVHDQGGTVYLLNTNYTISGGAPYHIFANNGGLVFLESSTVTISAPITVVDFVAASNGGHVASTLTTFVNPGNVTGAKFDANMGGGINSEGNGANYFPGSSPGTTSGLGIYNDTIATTLFDMPAGFSAEGVSFISMPNPALVLDKKASGQVNYLRGTTLGISRWEAQLGDATAESGTNAGSDLSFQSFADVGTFIGTALKLVRSTLAAVFGSSVKVTTYFASTAPVIETSAARTVGDTDNFIIGNRAGTITLTLPTVGSYIGRTIRVQTITANTVISNASNVVLVDGSGPGTAILAGTAGKWADLTSDGVHWLVTASN